MLGLPPDQSAQILKIADEEVSPDKLRVELVKKYANYFSHYIFYSVLLAFFAIIGLALSIVCWESTFTSAFRAYDPLNPDPQAYQTYRIYLNLEETMHSLIGISTAVSIFVCFQKHLTKTVWQEFSNPIEFYKKLVIKQVELGAIDEDAITDNFRKQSGFMQVMKDKVFWAEVFMLVLAPYPHKGGAFSKTFTLTAINWVDNSGTYSAHTHAYPVTYM